MMEIIRAVKRFTQRHNPMNVVMARLLNHINRREYAAPRFTKFNERSIEYRFVFEQISSLVPKDILDVGTGVTALPSLMANCGCRVTAIDNIRDYWEANTVNRHYYVIDDDITDSKITETFDLVTCVSTLEHIERFDRAVASMFARTKPGGHVLLTFPYHERRGVDHVYALPGSEAKDVPRRYKTRALSRENIERWGSTHGAEVVKQEYWQFFSGDYWTVGERLPKPLQVSAAEKHQISCVLFRKK